MDDGTPKVAVESAVMTVRTREVGMAWATRSLGIALAICMCLTVGGDLTARAAAEPWSGILDPSRAIDWSHAGIPGRRDPPRRRGDPDEVGVHRHHAV